MIKAEKVEEMIPLLRGNYMGIYNVVTSLLGGSVTIGEMQELLDQINNAANIECS